MGGVPWTSSFNVNENGMFAKPMTSNAKSGSRNCSMCFRTSSGRRWCHLFPGVTSSDARYPRSMRCARVRIVYGLAAPCVFDQTRHKKSCLTTFFSAALGQARGPRPHFLEKEFMHGVVLGAATMGAGVRRRRGHPAQAPLEVGESASEARHQRSWALGRHARHAKA